jgi:hypothetical protein
VVEVCCGGRLDEDEDEDEGMALMMGFKRHWLHFPWEFDGIYLTMLLYIAGRWQSIKSR